MKFKQFIQQLRFRTRTDEYTLPDEDICMLYNGEIDGLALLGNLPALNEHWFGVEKEIEVVNGQIEIPSDTIHIHKVELGDDEENWKLSIHYRLNRMPTPADSENIIEMMKDRLDGYAIFGKKMYILSENEVEKVRLFVSVYPEYIETSILNDENATLDNPKDDVVGLPRIFHQIMMHRCVIAWKGMQDKPIPLSAVEKQYNGDIMTVIKNLEMLDTNKKYRMRKHRLKSVYGTGDNWNMDSAEQQYEMCLVDGDGVYLTI